MKNLQCSYSEVMKMPIYQRRLFLMKLKELYDNRKEELDNNTSTNSNGKKTISGDSLKTHLRNNPNT